MSMKFITSSIIINKNCENDDDLLLDWDNIGEENSNQGNNACNNDEQNDQYYQLIIDVLAKVTTELEIISTDQFSEHTTDISENAKRYFIGYSIFKVAMNKYDCKDCQSVMIKNRTELLSLPSEFLITNKNYGTDFEKMALQPPSDKLFAICSAHFKIFDNFFKNQLHILNLKRATVETCMQATNKQDPEWFSEKHPCFLHRKALLDFMILVLLRKNCLWLSNKAANGRGKLQIFNS